MTESDPGVESERASHIHPWLTGTAPRGGQGVWLFSLTQVSFSFALRSVRNRDAVPAAIKLLAPSVLWLACEVHFGRAALQAQRLKYSFRNSVGQTTEWSMRNGITQILA